MRFLLYSDIHHGAGFRYGRVDERGLNSRLKTTLQIEKQISEIIEEKKIDFVVFLGDLVERSIFSYINDFVREILIERIKICPHFFLRGNHDKYFKGFDIYGDVYNPFTNVLREPSVIVYKTIKLGFLPYSEGSINEKVDFLFVHRDIQGADLGYIKLNIGEDIRYLSGLASKVFCGHIHKPQLFSKNMLCLGSTIETDISECDGLDRGIYIYDTDNAELELIIPDVPRLKRLEIDLDKIDESEIIKNLEQERGNNIFINITGKRELVMDFMHERDKIIKRFNLENLTFLPRFIESEKDKTGFKILGVQKSFEERFSLYLDMLPLEGLDKEKLKHIGWEILSGIKD